jgi:hypothetical protein
VTSVRLVLLVAAVLFAGCAPAPRPVELSKPDPTKEAWYGETTEQVAALTRDAESLFRNGKADQASSKISAGQPLISRLLSAPRPTLAAMEAVSDLDDLYGRMLLANRHYGWARLLFQKNQARWNHWRPQTEETVRRRKAAESGMAECDRRLE